MRVNCAYRCLTGPRTYNAAMTAAEPSRREMILDSAIALFRTHGFHGAGIDEIGAAAGISGPGVYRHFPNKHALLVAMSERVVDRLLAHNDRVRSEESDATAALERLVRTQVSFALGSREQRSRSTSRTLTSTRWTTAPRRR